MQPLPFGAELGRAPGDVPAYSSDYDSVDSNAMPNRHAFRHYINAIYTGYKWQCVEFARRWLLLNKGYIFDDIAMAYDIFRLKQVKCVDNGALLPLRAFSNGSQRKPEPGCMLIWQEGGEFEVTGHVAIVTEVLSDKVRIAEQNNDHMPWPAGANYARELPLRVDESGGHWLSCTYSDTAILGWVVQTDEDAHAETFTPPAPELFGLKLRDIGDEAPWRGNWLDESKADQAAYVRMMDGHKMRVHGSQSACLYLSESAAAELKRATNELHALFLHATDFVVQRPELAERFNIPPMLWPRIQQSWNNRRQQMLTGRFDFCMTEQGLKVYEYNADSASCYMECGKIQGLWAAQLEQVDGRDPGARLFQELIDGWRQLAPDEQVHVMYDHDLEETYHALYMQGAMREAGVSSKAIKGLSGLRWGKDGEVLDQDGTPIRWVWKTWAWETALEQLRQELTQTLGTITPTTPQLKDVLLRPNVMVFEPLWTLITSNKAMLPMLWEMFPDFPYLLECGYELSPSLQRQGYVSKPIAGRCGDNIAIVSAEQGTVEETAGRFDYQQTIYQALCPLPCVEQHFVQLCCFTVEGSYAGACARVDSSPIITAKSDVMPLRILADEAFLALR